MDYYTTTNIHLYLEPFHNAGLTPGETKNVLERMGYYVRPAGVNNNWIIDSRRASISEECFTIEIRLLKLIKEKGLKTPFQCF